MATLKVTAEFPKTAAEQVPPSSQRNETSDSDVLIDNR